MPPQARKDHGNYVWPFSLTYEVKLIGRGHANVSQRSPNIRVWLTGRLSYCHLKTNAAFSPRPVLPWGCFQPITECYLLVVQSIPSLGDGSVPLMGSLAHRLPYVLDYTVIHDVSTQNFSLLSGIWDQSWVAVWEHSTTNQIFACLISPWPLIVRGPRLTNQSINKSIPPFSYCSQGTPLHSSYLCIHE